MAQTKAGGIVTSSEVLTGDVEFFTLFTTLDITATDSFTDNTQKDFESVVQVISLRAQPMLMNTPIIVDGVSAGLEDYGSPTLTGAGWVFKFAFERQGAHTLDTLQDELNGIVLNGGTIDTKSSKNMEFSKQDVL
tara:strand:+ start:687 stop:1091 length:405 start_codon:yes stop_codon:yes gene_type:complete